MSIKNIVAGAAIAAIGLGAMPAYAKTVKVTLHAVEKNVQIDNKGTEYPAWTFGGTVPGPVLRVRQGDEVRIRLVNQAPMGHSIDFHASEVAWNDEMRSIKPGESLVYQFKAQRSGAWMYHCGTAPVLHHIGNGMYGLILLLILITTALNLALHWWDRKLATRRRRE